MHVDGNRIRPFSGIGRGVSTISGTVILEKIDAIKQTNFALFGSKLSGNIL